MLIVLSTYAAFCFLKVQCKHEVNNKHFVLEMHMHLNSLSAKRIEM